jgi:uncharacterized membrane protein
LAVVLGVVIIGGMEVMVVTLVVAGIAEIPQGKPMIQKARVT